MQDLPHHSQRSWAARSSSTPSRNSFTPFYCPSLVWCSFHSQFSPFINILKLRRAIHLQIDPLITDQGRPDNLRRSRNSTQKSVFGPATHPKDWLGFAPDASVEKSGAAQRFRRTVFSLLPQHLTIQLWHSFTPPWCWEHPKSAFTFNGRRQLLFSPKHVTAVNLTPWNSPKHCFRAQVASHVFCSGQ